MNMVNECFELGAVICRLAGRPEYCSPDFGAFNTDYHKEITETFTPFINHDAVKYVKQFHDIIQFDKILQFAVHIIKKDNKFIFIEDINSLFITDWTEKHAYEFLKLFNMFYIDSKYESFFNTHLKFFEESSKIFFDKYYGNIDLEWFRKYVNPVNLRCIYSLSSGNYAATVNNKIIYCLVHIDGGAIIHEYCHSFANPIAEKMYNENKVFKKWCNESVNLERMPFYSNGQSIAYEYITKAYNILYEVHHGKSLNEELIKEKDTWFKNCFKYMEEIYNLIKDK